MTMYVGSSTLGGCPWLGGLMVVLAGLSLLNSLLLFTWWCGVSKGHCLPSKWMHLPWFFYALVFWHFVSKEKKREKTIVKEYHTNNTITFVLENNIATCHCYAKFLSSSSKPCCITTRLVFMVNYVSYGLQLQFNAINIVFKPSKPFFVL